MDLFRRFTTVEESTIEKGPSCVWELGPWRMDAQCFTNKAFARYLFSLSFSQALKRHLFFPSLSIGQVNKVVLKFFLKGVVLRLRDITKVFVCVRETSHKIRHDVCVNHDWITWQLPYTKVKFGKLASTVIPWPFTSRSSCILTSWVEYRFLVDPNYIIFRIKYLFT